MNASEQPEETEADPPAPAKKTPGPLVSAAKLVGALITYTARSLAMALMAALRAIGKFIITVWRLAAALDSALWRAAKLIARHGFSAVLVALGWAGIACRAFVRWLPTRSGRAYTAVSGFWLIIAGLWMVDELRSDPEMTDSGSFVLRPPIDEEDPILARIEGRYVHLSEIEAAARAGGLLRDDEVLTAKSAFDRELVEAYVEQRLLARAALGIGLQRQPQILRRVNAARDRVLAAAFMEDRLDGAVTPETVERLYNSTSDITRLGDEVRARHILVETGEEADDIVALLKEGSDFGELARTRSKDRATAPLGGEIGWFTRAMMTPVFSKAAFAATPGEVAAPFQTEFGWHIIEITGRRSSKDVPFDSVKDNIESYLRLRTIDSTIADLSEENQVVYFRPEEEATTDGPPPPDLILTPQPQSGGDSETMN